MYLLGGFEGTLIRENVGKWRNLHILHKNNAIVVKPLLGSLGKELLRGAIWSKSY